MHFFEYYSSTDGGASPFVKTWANPAPRAISKKCVLQHEPFNLIFTGEIDGFYRKVSLCQSSTSLNLSVLVIQNNLREKYFFPKETSGLDFVVNILQIKY